MKEYKNNLVEKCGAIHVKHLVLFYLFFHELIKNMFENEIFLFFNPQETFYMHRVVDVLRQMCCVAHNYFFYRKD